MELCQLGDVGRELSGSSMGVFGHALDGIDGEKCWGGGGGGSGCGWVVGSCLHIALLLLLYYRVENLRTTSFRLNATSIGL